MFKYNKRMEEERQYYEDMLARSEQRQTANLLVGLIVGAAAGYCAKKYVLPKLAEVEYKERLAEETDFLKERFNDLKQSVLSLKDKLPFGDCCDDLCCCCNDECDDECCDEECCDDDGCCDATCCETKSQAKPEVAQDAVLDEELPEAPEEDKVD